ncbi:MAG: hypothetical protein JO203_14730 [Gammaproteobacteria bacterium]|nr:hypothetical protein [Gammaproteobacteria bacterium]
MQPDELKIWLNHFEYHAQRPRQVAPGLGDVLTGAERRLIAGSIATFQLGEQSEGHTLVRAAQRFAAARQLPALVRIVELFVREEQHHAALLRAFMEDHHIPLKTRDWTDRVFRCLRRLAGLELYLHVLVTAELIGNVYYRALASATGCQRLKVLCRTLVADELVHVAFESQLLLALSRSRPRWVRRLLRSAHRAFLAGTACIVWLTHRPLLLHCGYGARTFLGLCLAQYGFYLQPLDVPLASGSQRAGRPQRGHR